MFSLSHGPHFTQIIAFSVSLFFYFSKIQTLDQCEARHARPVCLRSNEMFALSVHDGANVNQLQCRSGSLFLAFALISVERRTLDYDSVHLLNIKVCTHYDLSFDGFHKFPFSFISLENMVCFEGKN